MRFFDLITLSMRMFKARTMRTLLTILGMSVGIAAIIFLVSFGYGLQQTLLHKITTADALITLDVTVGEATPSEKLDQATIEKLRGIEGVADIIPVLELPGQGKFETLTLDIHTVSSSTSHLKNTGLEPKSGRFFTPDELSGVIVTSAVASVLGLSDEEILGKEVRLTLFQSTTVGQGAGLSSIEPPTPYSVVGVVSGEENDLYLALDSLSTFPIDTYTALKVKSTSTHTLDQVRGEIERLGFVVSSLSETIEQANKVFNAIQIILMVFGMIALTVSAIGMFNTMTIALLERTEEIGIMQAIGASKNSISMMFMMESTLMGFLGALGGVFLGLTGGKILNALINVVAVRFGGEAVTLFYSPLWFILTVILSGAGIGLLTGVFPARKASHIDALDALRYK